LSRDLVRICYPPDSIIEMINLNGHIEDIQENLIGYDNTLNDYLTLTGDNQWLSAIDIYGNVILGVSFPEPEYIPAVYTTKNNKDADQYFIIYIKKANPEGRAPVLQLSLLYNNELILKSGKLRIVSRQGQFIIWHWDLGLLPDLKDVGCKVESFYTGTGTERSGAEIRALNWCGLYDLNDTE